jgi:hypothetical protein
MGLAARRRVGEGSGLYVRDKNAAYAAVFARIRENPLYYAAWFAQKPALLWQWSIAQGAGDIYVYPMLASPFESNVFCRAVAAICCGLNTPIAIAAFVGALLVLLLAWRGRLRPQDQALLLCALTFCYAELAYTALAPDARYANPFRPFEIVLAMSLLARLSDSYLSLRRAKRDGGSDSSEASTGLG